jgi:hypothetical protein
LLSQDRFSRKSGKDEPIGVFRCCEWASQFPIDGYGTQVRGANPERKCKSTLYFVLDGYGRKRWPTFLRVFVSEILNLHGNRRILGCESWTVAKVELSLVKKARGSV